MMVMMMAMMAMMVTMLVMMLGNDGSLAVQLRRTISIFFARILKYYMTVRLAFLGF